MDLRKKLDYYSGKTERGASGADMYGTVRDRRHGMDIRAPEPGEILTNDNGNCYLVENRYPLSYLYGGTSLGNILESDERILTALGDDTYGNLRPDRLLYLDTETTGLSAGAGTVAFLVGVGFFCEDSFILRQYFMRDYDEEAAMLTELKQLFSQYSGFVTFNGKAFDTNLLQSRFISNRIRSSFRELPNVDLLYPSRRIWGQVLESCRLISLEENILGEYRTDDIPGMMIPSVYFKYLDDRDASDMRRVFKHNRLDILTMVSLLDRLATMIGSPLKETDNDFALLGLGRLFESRGETDRMISCLEACTASEQFIVRSQAVKRLTEMYKRKGDYDSALGHWQAMANEGTDFDSFHLVEMAKYYEHRAKDFRTALSFTETALQKCPDEGSGGSRQYCELKKRLERLQRKILRKETY